MIGTRLSYRFLMLFFIGSAFSLSAQNQTIITGKIYDATTKEPLPFVNLLLKNTNVGTSTDINGAYRIVTTIHSDSLLASYVGYKLSAKGIINDKEQVINIFLEPEEQNLNEVVIHPGENPAFRILRKMVEHKIDNDPKKLDSYQFDAYNKIEFDLNNIPKRLENKKILKPINFIFKYIDSTNVKEKPYLPAFITETTSQLFYNRNPVANKEIIKGTKLSGFKNNSISQFMGDMYQDYDIYKNSSVLFGEDFISPLNNNITVYYRYYLIDSMNINGHYCYQIQFKPKHKQEFAFTGNMWISDTTFALVRLEMKMADDITLNYVQDFDLVQEYEKVDGQYWMIAKNKLTVDFALFKNSAGMYGRTTTLYDHFIINQPKEVKFYSLGNNVVVEDSASSRSGAYWDSARKEPLSKEEKNIYKMVDTFQTLPIYHRAINTFYLLATGFKTFGDFDIGPITDFYSYNTVEGDRFRFGGRTSVNFSKWYELGGYVAYGDLDKKTKYDIGLTTFITKDPWQQIEVRYNDDVKVLGRSDRLFQQDNILTSFVSRIPASNLTEIKETTFSYDRDIFKGLNLKLSFVNQTFIPTQNKTYEVLDDEGNISSKSAIYSPELRVNLNLAFDEKYVVYSIRRNATGTKYPTILFRYTKGLQGIFGGDYDYQKLVAGITYILYINPIGDTWLKAEAGRIVGNVPYPLLFLPPGNETYIFDRQSYNMMNYYEFVSDRYLALTAEHHFEGLLLNRIPLLRKLKWREVAAYKWLAGEVNPDNKQSLFFPQNMYTLNNAPYSEADVGIENIFKVVRIDALWRLSYLNHPNISKFAVMGSFEFIF